MGTKERLRLERAMMTGQRWSVEEFQERLVGNPLVRRLVLGVFRGEDLVATFRVAEDGTLADVGDSPFSLAMDGAVGIVHPLVLGASGCAAWAGVLADYEILQPFHQLGREVFALLPEEVAATTLDRFENVEAPTSRFLALEQRGWLRGAPQVEEEGLRCWMEYPVAGTMAIVIDLDPGIETAGSPGRYPRQRVVRVWVNDRPYGDWCINPILCFGDLDQVTASELLRDLSDLGG